MTYSYSSGIAPTLPIESFLQRRALENVVPELGYMDDAQVIEQPANGGKHAKFFRYTELPAAPVPLQEGVTPTALDLTETAFTVMTKQYGRHMEYTDELDLWHVDKKTIAMSDRLNRQAKLTIDTVMRDAVTAGLNVMFPGNVTSRGAIAGTDKISYAMIKKAVRSLKNKGAQPFADGFFHAKIDHDTYYDLSGDSHWIAVAQYQNDRRVQKYELGTIYNVKFFEVDNGKVFTTESYLYGTTGSLTAYANYDATNMMMTVTATMTEDEARELTGKLVYVNYSSTYNTLMCIERVYPSGTANQTKIKFRWQPAARRFRMHQPGHQVQAQLPDHRQGARFIRFTRPIGSKGERGVEGAVLLRRHPAGRLHCAAGVRRQCLISNPTGDYPLTGSPLLF